MIQAHLRGAEHVELVHLWQVLADRDVGDDHGDDGDASSPMLIGLTRATAAARTVMTGCRVWAPAHTRPSGRPPDIRPHTTPRQAWKSSPTSGARTRISRGSLTGRVVRSVVGQPDQRGQYKSDQCVDRLSHRHHQHEERFATARSGDLGQRPSALRPASPTAKRRTEHDHCRRRGRDQHERARRGSRRQCSR